MFYCTVLHTHKGEIFLYAVSFNVIGEFKLHLLYKLNVHVPFKMAMGLIIVKVHSMVKLILTNVLVL